ncbi:kinetochore Sim4 complex subunit FTA2-domain-containing protein [Truncatella angustata]|uniref:Kinetochore Sim4 complex subunit FTA2-domain-containing protein n=1 Tax=Truncatella angustata TaxID=152316 RepID=A0A9P8UTY7_9PEZI|nr:kinetochore Sim4 complex subunit FTA2-domain-containing protein [Truncatella angustata]KAH6658027.1 kinetochore Sim4 complex subunit FTA2-domain-containing protein [Truncatella angustata]
MLKSLPSIEGPKLKPFQRGRDVAIQFQGQVGSGAHSYVWKVSIDGQIYALKMFRFTHPIAFARWLQPARLKQRGVTCTAQRELQQLEPFSCECRAFARLKEAGEEAVAVGCHGYLLLTRNQEDELARRGLDDWVDRFYEDEDNYPVERGPIRAIVKEYIEDGEPFRRPMVPRMQRDFLALHRCGIAHRDTWAKKFRGGKVVDFSTSWTVPHHMLDLAGGDRSPGRIYEHAGLDAIYFDRMIDEWNERHGYMIWSRITPNVMYYKRLRGWRGRWDTRSLRDMMKVHPADYDWEAPPHTSK